MRRVFVLDAIDGDGRVSNSIFLAGPTPRDAHVDSWRPEAVEMLNAHGFTGDVFLPETDTSPATQRRITQ